MEPNQTEFSQSYLEHENFYIGVGLSISRWSDMETTIVQIFSILMGTQDQKAGIVLYSIMNFNAWLMIIDELIGSDPLFEGFKRNWSKKANRLRRLNETRVRLAHHTMWESGPTDLGLKPSRLDARSKSRSYKSLTIPEIVEFVNLSFEMHKDLVELRKALTLAASKKPSPDRSQPQQGDPHPSDAQ